MPQIIYQPPVWRVDWIIFYKKRNPWSDLTNKNRTDPGNNLPPAEPITLKLVNEAGKKDYLMKFFIVEQNIGGGATKKQAEKLIEMLKAKGWDVEYGAKRNVATDISEFGREESIQSKFADDFMECIALMEE